MNHQTSIRTLDGVGRIAVRYLPEDAHGSSEIIAIRPEASAIYLADNQPCPCSMYGTPCQAYEVELDSQQRVGEVHEVELPTGHRSPITIQLLDDRFDAGGVRRARVTCSPGMNPAEIVRVAITETGEGTSSCADGCTCEFSRADYPVLVRCEDAECPLPLMEIPTYEDSVAWARIHHLTGCAMTSIVMAPPASGGRS